MPGMVAAAVVLLLLPIGLEGLVLRRARLSAFVDGLALTAVLGLLGLHIVPEALEAAGAAGVIALGAGFLLPWAGERLGAPAGAVRGLAAMVGLAVLLLHAAIDGVTLAAAASRPELGVAVVIHQLPVGLAVWVAHRARSGPRAAVAGLVAMAAVTVGAWAVGERLLAGVDGRGLALVQCLAAGSLFHVAAHSGLPGGARHPRVAGLGALVALAWLVLAPTGEDDHASVAGRVGHLLVDSAPALLAGSLLTGGMAWAAPRLGVAGLRGRTAWGTAARGVAFGLPLPGCGCGVLPVYRDLVRQGAPVGAAVAFLVAAPELGPHAVLLSLPFLGPWLTGLRVLGAVGLAMVVGVYLGRGGPGPAPAAAEGEAPPRSWRDGLARTAEAVDHLGPWMVGGLLVAAWVEPALGPGALAAIPPAWQVPLFALAGLPAYVCAASATPLAAVLLAHGATPGAVLAFLFTGPATHLATLRTLRDLHGVGAAARFAAAMVVLPSTLGWAVDALAGPWVGVAPEAEAHAPSAGAIALTGVLGVVLLASLLRRGPRGWLAQLVDDDPAPGSLPLLRDPPPGGVHLHDHAPAGR